jgi:hypothetical protein
MDDPQTPPEEALPSAPPEEALPSAPPEVDDLDPERPADGVDEDRLTGYAVYDNLEAHYLNGVERGRGAKARADKRADGDRFTVRRV